MIERRLCDYVAIRSLSREEGALADRVFADLAEAGLQPRRIGDNVICEIGDAPRPRLLLNSHLDTVPASDGWKSDPWTPTIDGDRIIGLGANDAKGCGVAMIETVLALRQRRDRGQRIGGTVVLALTVEEEIAGDGLCAIVDQLGPLDAGIVGEPTSLTPMTAQRGLLILKGRARGRTAHPANTPPDTDSNAIQIAADDARHLLTFDWGPVHPLLGRSHGHITRMNGGVANNVIPDLCEFMLDIRTTTAEVHAAMTDRLRQHLRSEITVHSDRMIPIETADDADIVRAVCAALPDARPTGSPAMSDMVWLRGIPAVKIGPGDTRRSHTPNEYITRSELQAGLTAYTAIAKAYFARVGTGD